MMITRKVRLPLTRTVKRYLSSDNYSDSVEQAFNLLDALYTYFFRYPMLLEEIKGGMSTDASAVEFIASNPIAGVGLTLLLGVVAAAGVVSEYRKQTKAAEEKAGTFEAHYKRIQTRPEAKAAQVEPASPSWSLPSTTLKEESDSDLSLYEEEKTQELSPLSRAEEGHDRIALSLTQEALRKKSLNERLEGFRLNDPLLKAKYKEISITEDGQVEFTFNEKKPEDDESPGILKRIGKKFVSLASASWVTLGLCSFAYWILWIGSGVATGHFAPAGIDGLGAAGFAVPIAIGGLYPLIKIRNWWKNHYGQKVEKQPSPKPLQQIEEDPRLVLAAAAEISKLLQKAIFADEKARLGRELEKMKLSPEALKIDVEETYISGDEEIVLLGQNKWKKTAITGLAATVSTYIAAQYGAWIVTDLLKMALGVSLNIPGLSIGIGIAFMVGSTFYGIYKAYERYQEVKKYAATIEKQELKLNSQVSTLEKLYEEKTKKLEKLKEELLVLSKDPADQLWLVQQAKLIKSSTLVAPLSQKAPEPTTFWDKTKKFCSRAYAFLGGATTGIMIGRIATISGSAIFLPFAAAALATPYTIGILVAVGVVYGLFKAYQYHQARKEAKAKALFESRAEKIEALKEQSEVADLQIKLLSAKKAELLNRASAEPQATEKQPGVAVKARDDVALVQKRSTALPAYAGSSQTLFARQTKDDLDRVPLSASLQYQLVAARA
jgi:hypothetical protein